MSVNNSIFKGDDFKLKFQMLHLGMDVLFVIWSTTIGKIVSGHSLDCRFFFLVIFPFVASPFILSFFWKVCICSAKGGTPLDPRFVFFLLLSFLFFASLLFTFLFLLFALHSLVKEQFCFVFSTQRTYHRGRYMCTIEIIDREFVGSNCRITERKMVFFAFCIYPSCRHFKFSTKHVLAKRGEYPAYRAKLRSAFLRFPQY